MTDEEIADLVADYEARINSLTYLLKQVSKNEVLVSYSKIGAVVPEGWFDLRDFLTGEQE